MILVIRRNSNKQLVKLLQTYFFGSRVTFWREEVVCDKLSFAQVVSCSLLDQLTPVSVSVICKNFTKTKFKIKEHAIL